MDYKKIFKSRELRFKILSLMDWVPDSIMLRLQYWIQTGRKLNLKNPKRFTEKMQVYKMKCRNSDMLRCTDKYEVREYVTEKGLKDILIPLIGIYNNVNEILFENLPNQFVAKTTDGGGGTRVYICKDKDKTSKDKFLGLMDDWMRSPKPKKHFGREWAYENNYPRRILIEELIGNTPVQNSPIGGGKDCYLNCNQDSLLDYKIFCFNGEPKLLYISDNEKQELVFLDLEWNVLPFLRRDYHPIEIIPQKPANLEQMIAMARQLAQPFPHVRVDLYNVNGKIYFGELTFYTSSGYINFEPDNVDFILGKYFNSIV